MNWEAVGVIVEAIGVLAVLITLIYLAIQTRLTRKAVEDTSEHAKQQATHSSVGMYSDWRRSLIGSPELAEILARARRNEELSESDQVLFAAYFEDLFFAAVTSYRSALHETVDYADSIDVLHLIDVLNANPKAVIEWNRISQIVAGISPEFAAAINDGLNAATAPNGVSKSD